MTKNKKIVLGLGLATLVVVPTSIIAVQSNTKSEVNASALFSKEVETREVNDGYVTPDFLKLSTMMQALEQDLQFNFRWLTLKKATSKQLDVINKFENELSQIKVDLNLISNLNVITKEKIHLVGNLLAWMRSVKTSMHQALGQ